MRDRVDRVIKRIHDLPTLPLVYKRVNELLQNPYTSASDIAAVVGEDQVLTTKLLRLVNSAHYNYAEKVERVSRAVSLVGTEAVRDLVLATSVMDLFKEERRDTWSLPEYWRHSLGVAVSARAVGEARGEGMLEEYFVAGLIHDIGKIVWIQYFEQELQELLEYARDQRVTMLQAENDKLGINHARVGRLVARHWGLPERLVEAIAWHHEPRLSEKHAEFVAVVHVADCIANGMRLGQSGNGITPWIKPDAWDLVGLPLDRIEALVEKIDLEFQDSLLLMGFWDEEEKARVQEELSRS